MAYSIEFKHQAIKLRQKGYSVKEVSEEMKISKSTSSLWLRNIDLNNQAQLRLQKRKLLGQYKTSLIWREKRKTSEKIATRHAAKLLSTCNYDQNSAILICASLFWAEGSKNKNGVIFTNSDPNMVKTFLFCFRKSFKLKESKFHCLVHIHDYHNDSETKKFWSEITNIPLSQFYRSYRKPHTEKRKRPGYPGCIRVAYFDTFIARELRAVYNILATKFGPVG